MNKISFKPVIFFAFVCTLFVQVMSPAVSTEGFSEGKGLTCQTFVNVSKKALPAVVSIDVKKKLERQGLIRRQDNGNRDDLKKFFEKRGFPPFNEDSFPFFLPFFEKGEIEIPASGSGVIIRSDGYIVTNYHVIANAKSGDIKVKLNDETTFEGEDVEIVGEDDFTDLAVLRLKTDKKLPALDFAESENLEIGEWVLALGSPLELKGSVTQGIISAKHRVIGKALIEDLIQTTAVINPGNSGGPLVNLDGKIVGINTAIASNTGRWQGVGFAIPSDTVKNVCESIIESGKAKRGWLGIHMAELTPDIKEYFGLKDVEGIMVAKVIEDSPAEAEGIESYDIITAVDGKKITNSVEMIQQIAPKAVGTKVEISLYRQDGKKAKVMEIDVRLGERPTKEELTAVREKPEIKKSTDFDDMGLKFKGKSPESKEKGLVIAEVKQGSPADKGGLRSGDVIIELNRVKINTLDDFHDAMKKAEKDRDHIIMFERGTEILFSMIGRK